MLAIALRRLVELLLRAGVCGSGLEARELGRLLILTEALLRCTGVVTVLSLLVRVWWWLAAGAGSVVEKGADCGWRRATSAGLRERRATSDVVDRRRVIRAIGGPYEVSIPWLLCEAGGFRDAGDRASALEGACGPK